MEGDGWTNGPIGDQLAKLLANKLGDNAPKINHEISGRSKNETYWLKTGWKKWSEGDEKWLPMSSNDLKPLPRDERELLKRAIFNENDDTGGKRRLRVAIAIGNSKTDEHSKLCAAIVEELNKYDDIPELELLVPFSQFADSALDVIKSVWEEMGRTQKSEKTPIEDFIKKEDIKDKLAILENFAYAWKENKDNFYSISNLAKDIVSKSGNNSEILKTLIQHHTTYGGGRKWFKLTGNDIEPLMSIQTQGASYYRFRLWQLGCLAIQCGIINKIPNDLYEKFEEQDEE